MKHLNIKHTAAALACAGSLASAGEIVQTYNYDLNGTIFTNDSFGMDSFDTMGGTRELTDIKINLDGTYAVVLSAENEEETPIGADEYFFEGFVAITLDIAGLSTGGIWSQGWGGLSADLAANDANPGSGPDYHEWNFGGAQTQELFFNDTFFAAFTTNGAGTIDGTLGVFTDLLLTPPPPFFSPNFDSHHSAGTFSLTYIYDTVPAPSGVSVLALAGLGAARRRR